MLNLSSQLSDAPDRRSRAPWAEYEHFRGWGVFGLPFDSGHVLALRVVPESDFGGYRTLWHRDPEGGWSIFVDGPRLDTACPRYYSKALAYAGFASIGLEWTGPATLNVTLDSPELDWTLTARSNWVVGLLNAVNGSLPLATWRPAPLVWARELIAKGLGMGDLELSMVMPNGQTGTLMPQRMYFIDDSVARIDGLDLGKPVHLRENPRIGTVPLPARGVLATGRALLRIADIAAYERTLAEVSLAPGNGHVAPGERRDLTEKRALDRWP